MIQTYFLLFIIYSTLGWLIEVIGKLIEKHRFINRGFLIGPLCPIYGWGSIIMIILLKKYQSDILVLFIMAIIICSIIEYFTSYVMEKIFHIRWWDYTRRKYNLNGRICLETMIPFGIMGCLMIYIINPLFISILDNIGTNTLNIISSIIFIIFLIDNIITTKTILSFNGTIRTIEKDGTEEITKRIKKAILSKNYLHKRLINAFPSIITSRERLEILEKKINEELNKHRPSNKIKKIVKKIKNK